MFPKLDYFTTVHCTTDLRLIQNPIDLVSKAKVIVGTALLEGIFR